MIHILRFLLICVSIYTKISTAEDAIEYLDLNIADLGGNFYKFESTNYDKILLNEDLKSENKCVGKVFDGSKELVGVPDNKFNYRFVKIVKVPKVGDYNPDLEEIDKDDSVQASHTVDSNFESVLEVHTLSSRSVMIDRFKKNDSDEYVQFDYEFVDVDLCQPLGNTETVGETKYLKVENFKTVGTIKCKDKVLLDSLNVFYRTLEVNSPNFVVKTVPKSGFPYMTTYTLHESRDHVNPKRNYRVQMSLKLDKLSPNYSVTMSSCGTDCVFFDGCNEKFTFIDVFDNQFLYKNPNTFCLSVKSEDVRGTKFLTIFDLHRNSTVFLVKMLKHDGRGFVDYKKNPLDMDFTKFTDPKPVHGNLLSNLVSYEFVGSYLLTRVLDVEFKIGKILFNRNVVLDDNEEVFNREVYSSRDGLLVHDQLYNGESRRYLFRPEFEEKQDDTDASQTPQGSTEGSSDDSSQTQPQTPVIKDLKLDYEDGVKVDLHNITIHVSAYFTYSEMNLFVKPSSLVEKLGTLSYKEFLTYPNKFYVDRQYLILGHNDAMLHASTWKGFSFSESFVKVPTLKGDNDVFVTKAKDLEHFDVQLFYESFVIKNLGKFANFDINNLGDYYLVGVNYKKLYTSLIGNVTVGYHVFAPLDMDLVSRYLLLPKNSQSFVVIMDCDYTDCWTKFYKETSSKGQFGYEVQEKEPKDLDLIKVFENDRDGSKPFYSFDVFKVSKHGKVYYVRVLNELTHKIGKVLYKGNTLFEDGKEVFTRMVNVSRNKDSDGNQIGNLRVLDIERWEKSTRHYTYKVEDDNFKLTKKEKIDFELDLEPSARKNNMLNISERNEVLSYYLNWNYKDDYNLTKLTYSEYDKTNKEFNQNNVMDNLDNYPVYVRLHKNKDKEFVLVVENHGEHGKAKNDEFFKLTTNAAKHGLLLKYDIENKNSEGMSDFPKDLYHRRNFTSHRHHFTTSSATAAKPEETDV